MQSSEWLHSHLLKVGPIRRSVEVPSIERAKDGYVGRDGQMVDEADVERRRSFGSSA